MSKIRIKNFGPIKEGYQKDDGWMDIKKVTLFIGNQGSGKSVVAKVISTMLWIEKAINRGDLLDSWSINDFKQQFKYQNLGDYFKADTVIEYIGEQFAVSYDIIKNKYPVIEKRKEANYIVPKIMYVPAERNFLSVIKNATGVRGLPATLFEFAEELKRGQADTKGEEIPLPINGVSYKYESDSDSSFIIGKDYKVNLLIASSGFQSLVPLFLVSSSLAQLIKSGSEITPANISVDQSIRMNREISAIMLDNKMQDQEKLKKVEEVKAKFQNKAFINIVEEPEQNLFPGSQQKMLNCLLAFNNMNAGNKLILTTHSPYLVNYLTHSVKAAVVLKKINNSSKVKELTAKLDEVVPVQSTVAPDDWVVYELDERDGTINKLKDYNGLPSDANFLNEKMAEGNEIFGKLLDIEDLCQ
jgi:predicted ATPase